VIKRYPCFQQVVRTLLIWIKLSEDQPNNPLHGVKLLAMLQYLVSAYGWEELGDKINIRCFNYDPSIKSSLTFLRRTPMGEGASGAAVS
jgi:uncharacterized protein (DUF2132 family)